MGSSSSLPGIFYNQALIQIYLNLTHWHLYHENACEKLIDGDDDSWESLLDYLCLFLLLISQICKRFFKRFFCTFERTHSLLFRIFLEFEHYP
jgi:hypothetical protein